ELLTTIKHPSFEAEGEWRVVRRLRTHEEFLEVQYREGKFCLIPYFHFKLPVKDGRLAIDHAFLGPSAEEDLSFYSLSALLVRQANCANLERSGIPLRAW